MSYFDFFGYLRGWNMPSSKTVTINKNNNLISEHIYQIQHCIAVESVAPFLREIEKNDVGDLNWTTNIYFMRYNRARSYYIITVCKEGVPIVLQNTDTKERKNRRFFLSHHPQVLKSWNKKFVHDDKKRIVCWNKRLNQGASDLQSDALPNELF